MSKEKIIQIIHNKIEETENKKKKIDYEIKSTFRQDSFVCYEMLIEQSREAFIYDEEVRMLNDILDEIGE